MMGELLEQRCQIKGVCVKALIPGLVYLFVEALVSWSDPSSSARLSIGEPTFILNIRTTVCAPPAKSTKHTHSQTHPPAQVNLFKDDGNVIHFASPKVQASIAANTYVVSGNAETKRTHTHALTHAKFLIPEFQNSHISLLASHFLPIFLSSQLFLFVVNHFTLSSLIPPLLELQDLLPGIINQLGPDNLEDLKKIYASYAQDGTPAPAAAGGDDDDDDDVPDLVDGNFEDAGN